MHVEVTLVTQKPSSRHHLAAYIIPWSSMKKVRAKNRLYDTKAAESSFKRRPVGRPPCGMWLWPLQPHPLEFRCQLRQLQPDLRLSCHRRPCHRRSRRNHIRQLIYHFTYLVLTGFNLQAGVGWRQPGDGALLRPHHMQVWGGVQVQVWSGKVMTKVWIYKVEYLKQRRALNIALYMYELAAAAKRKERQTEELWVEWQWAG